MSERYNVNSPLKHDGEQYHPETENNTIELSEKHAKPLLAVNAISVIQTESKEEADIPAKPPAVTEGAGDIKPEGNQSKVVPIKSTMPEGKQQQLDDIKLAIDGLAADVESNWTKANKADTQVLTKLLGWNVTALLRDEAAAIESDK